MLKMKIELSLQSSFSGSLEAFADSQDRTFLNAILGDGSTAVVPQRMLARPTAPSLNKHICEVGSGPLPFLLCCEHEKVHACRN